MEASKTNSTRQGIALFLLCVFAALFLVKAFHHHEPSASAQTAQQGISTAKAENACAVCDYHLTPVSEIPLVSFCLASLVIVFQFSTRKQTSPLSSVGLCFADRGPPSRC